MTRTVTIVLPDNYNTIEEFIAASGFVIAENETDELSSTQIREAIDMAQQQSIPPIGLIAYVVDCFVRQTHALESIAQSMMQEEMLFGHPDESDTEH